MSRPVVRVIVKPTPSKCNQTLIEFMRGEIAALRGVADVKVVIAYDVSKLRTAGVKSLPIMITSGRVIAGAPAIIAELKRMRGGGAARDLHILAGGDDVTQIWNEEMHSKADEETEPGGIGDMMKRVEEMSEARRKMAPPRGRGPPGISDAGGGGAAPKQPSRQTPTIDNTITVLPAGQDIMRGDDELMNKYWAAQEEETRL